MDTLHHIHDGVVAPLSSPETRNDSATSDQSEDLRSAQKEFVTTLERAFEQSFTVVDVSTGRIVHTGEDSLCGDLYPRLATCAEVARRGRPEILDEFSPLLMLAVPLPATSEESPLVAASTFLTGPIEEEGQIKAAAREFGIPEDQAFHWAKSHKPWQPHAALQLSSIILEKAASVQEESQLKQQLVGVSANLLSTFEEITLLHRLTQKLSLSSSVVELCELAVRWLAELLPAECIAIKLDRVEDIRDQHELETAEQHQPVLIVQGNCPLERDEFDAFLAGLGPLTRTDPIVMNRDITAGSHWHYPTVLDLLTVPIREGENFFGWLIAFNHTGVTLTPNSEAEFGTVEASSMSSVAALLGIHGRNIALYRQQAEFFASVVRALTSAIDAKDPYTCGHSDRVARLSVCLARRMGCCSEDLDTIYLSGLLHDIGKIGINDAVLRKPGPLTKEELEHIKTHPELGHKILNGVKQLDKVLPVVLHHHEAWDGSGYPHGLAGEESPLLARIVAVADSIDAMSSDRPYRKGIPDQELVAILRKGAGGQWDPCVISAAFQVREEIRRIGEAERKPLSLNVEKWQKLPSSAAEVAEVISSASTFVGGI